MHWVHLPVPGVSLKLSVRFWLCWERGSGPGLSCTYFSLCAKPTCSSGPGTDQKLPLDGRAGELREAVIWLGKQNLNNTQSLALHATTAVISEKVTGDFSLPNLCLSCIWLLWSC